MKVKITITNKEIISLLKCKETKKKNFENWDLNRLLSEAISEFHYKYGKG